MVENEPLWRALSQMNLGGELPFGQVEDGGEERGQAEAVLLGLLKETHGAIHGDLERARFVLTDVS